MSWGKLIFEKLMGQIFKKSDITRFIFTIEISSDEKTWVWGNSWMVKSDDKKRIDDAINKNKTNSNNYAKTKGARI